MRERPPVLVRLLARVLLRLYPPAFRVRYGADYVAGAEHIWVRERGRAGMLRAVGRVVRVMLADALTSVPAERRAGKGPEAFAGFAGELRLAVRMLVERPGYTLLVVGTLGLATGASAAVYGALDRVVLRPLPYPDGDRLAYLALRHRERNWQMAPYGPIVERWREGARTVERIETYRSFQVVRTGEGGAELVRTTAVSAGLPEMLGIRPHLGRMLGRADAEPAADPVVMLSERHWRGAWGMDPGVIGRSLRLNDSIFTVVGVWPESARLDYEGAPDLFRVLPRGQDAPEGQFTLVLAKLAPGAGPSVVEAELAALMAPAGGAHPFPDEVLARDDVVPAVNAPYGFLGEAYVRGLWMVFAGGLVLLVVAIVNAANVVLGRSFARVGEMRIRMALGGSRLRLLRLFLVESTVLSVAGGALGLAVLAAMQRVLQTLEPGRLVPPGATALQHRVLLFAAGLAALSALVCSVMPLLQLRAAGLASAGGARFTPAPARTRTVLIAGQTALAVLLVAGAALAARSLVAILDVDTGMDLDHLAMVAVSVSRPPYDEPARRQAYFDRVQSALASVPGAEGITRASNPPLNHALRGGVPFLDGEAEPEVTGAEFVAMTSAEPHHFRVTGIPLVSGRTFEPGETRVMIVNEAFARSRGGDVLGRTLRFPGDTLSWTIIGVVGDVSAFGLTSTERGVQLYTAQHENDASTYERFLIRTGGSPEAWLEEARARLAAIDPDVPLREATTGPAMVHRLTSRFRFVAFLLAAFATLGLGFAVAGVYGVVTLDVHRRVREVGVRMALGASHAQVARDVVRRGLAPVLIGGLIGGMAALWSGPVLEAVLFGVPARTR